MPKIIFTSRYLRDAPPEQLENYVRYIGTREGVEKVDESKRHLPATIHQKEFIKQLIRDIPQAKEMLEYADFLLHPTIGNASELISCALEQYLDLVAKRENYVRTPECGLYFKPATCGACRRTRPVYRRRKSGGTAAGTGRSDAA
jgi:hypothetical protein